METLCVAICAPENESRRVRRQQNDFQLQTGAVKWLKGVSQCAKSGHDALESPVTMLESAVTIPESPVTMRWNDRSRCGGMGGHDGAEYALVSERTNS
jgi:hypothetical protein